VSLARDLLVDQGLPHAGAFDSEAGHAINGVDGEAEAISLISDGQLQRRIDVALFLITTHVDMMLTRPAIGEPVN
jgi:hypothetical protein